MLRETDYWVFVAGTRAVHTTADQLYEYCWLLVSWHDCIWMHYWNTAIPAQCSASTLVSCLPVVSRSVSVICKTKLEPRLMLQHAFASGRIVLNACVPISYYVKIQEVFYMRFILNYDPRVMLQHAFTSGRIVLNDCVPILYYVNMQKDFERCR